MRRKACSPLERHSTSNAAWLLLARRRIGIHTARLLTASRTTRPTPDSTITSGLTTTVAFTRPRNSAIEASRLTEPISVITDSIRNRTPVCQHVATLVDGHIDWEFDE